jgi:hypothetical protein
MARLYGKLLTTIWRDPDFLKLTAGAQRLYMLLLSSPKLSAAGCVPLQRARWANLAPNTPVDHIERSLTELEAARFVLVDEATEEVLVRSFVAHDGAWRNPKMAKAVDNSVVEIESDGLRAVAAETLANLLLERRSIVDPIVDAIADRSSIDLRSGSIRTTTTTTPTTTPTTSRPVDNCPPSDDPRYEQVVEHYARIALEKGTARGGSVGNERAYRDTAARAVREREELPRWLEMFPTAPPDALAAWLHGDKGSQRYFPRCDELEQSGDDGIPVGPPAGVIHLANHRASVLPSVDATGGSS